MTFTRSRKTRSLFLGTKLRESLRPFPVSFLDTFFGIFKKSIVFAPRQIEFSINDLECIRYYVGSTAERCNATGSVAAVPRGITFRVRYKEIPVFVSGKVPSGVIP